MAPEQSCQYYPLTRLSKLTHSGSKFLQNVKQTASDNRKNMIIIIQNVGN